MLLDDNFSAFLSHTDCQLSMYKLLLSSTALTHLGVQCTRRRGSATTSFRTASISDRRTARNSRSALVSAFTMHSVAQFRFSISNAPFTRRRCSSPILGNHFPTRAPNLLLHSTNPTNPLTHQLHNLKIRRLSIEVCDELNWCPTSVRRNGLIL